MTGRVYDGSRMDTIWAFRQGFVLVPLACQSSPQIISRYDTARKIKKSQDEYCAKVFLGEWDELGSFPEDLQWEALVDVLRGRVKVGVGLHPAPFDDHRTKAQVHTHCYEATDIDGLVRVRPYNQFPTYTNVCVFKDDE